MSEQALLVTSLVPLPDGSGALATTSLFGVDNHQIVIGAAQVEEFIRQWREIKKREADMHRALARPIA